MSRCRTQPTSFPGLRSWVDELSLGWVEAKNGGPEVFYYVARSTDGGKTFSEPVPVHGKDASRPGFTTLAGASDGSSAGGLARRTQSRSTTVLRVAGPRFRGIRARRACEPRPGR